MNTPRCPYRRSIRLQSYDYSKPGAYFVTICAHKQECLFGKIREGILTLNDFGRIVESVWNDLPDYFSQITLDQFIVMPNHVHGIIIIRPSVGAGFPRPQFSSNLTGAETAPLQNTKLGKIVAYFKYQTTKQMNRISKTPGLRIWQRNYYEHIIRSEKSLLTIHQYIRNNPLKWDLDPENPLYFSPKIEHKVRKPNG